MDEMTKHDLDAGFEPAFAAPPNACDTHFHVFGAAERYTYGTDIRYKPPYEPLEAYLKLARRAPAAGCRRTGWRQGRRIERPDPRAC